MKVYAPWDNVFDRIYQRSEELLRTNARPDGGGRSGRLLKGYNGGRGAMSMPCPVCAALNREHNHECEAEANATLKRRADLLGSHGGDVSAREQLDQEVLRSRKRQAHIATELHHHQTEPHPVVKVVSAAAG
jgi:hypothetical protein